MLIRKSSDVIREVKRVRSRATNKVKRFAPTHLFVDRAAEDVIRLKHPMLMAEYEAVQEREREAVRLTGKRLHPDGAVERIYNTLRSNGFCPKDYTLLFHVIEDIDPCTAVAYKLSLTQDITALITEEMWKDAIYCALAFRVRETPVQVNSYFPFKDKEWKDFFLLTCSYLLRTPTVEVTKVVHKKTVAKAVVLPVDQKLKDRVEVLQATLASSEEEQRKRLKALAASYNKAIRAQSVEIARLRALLPTEAVQRIDAEPVPESELLPLPASGITFVGARGPTQQRLQQRYPDWDYIDRDEYPEEYPDNPVCFFNTKWISHKQYEHVKRWCPSNLLHCNLVNADRLELEMQEAYTSFMRGQTTQDDKEE